MKPLFTLFFLVLAAANTASADSFTIIREGQEYLCQATTSIPPHNPNGALECIDDAYRGPFSREEAVRICQGANSKAPAECATEAYRGPFSKEESLRLCARVGTREMAECAIRAYQGPYTREESIRICRQEPGLTIRALKLMESSSEMKFKIQQFKSRSLDSLQ